MKLKNRIVWVVSLGTLLLSGACSTPLRSVEVAGSPASINQSLSHKFVRYVMSDESWIFVESPRDFGSAICGRNICLNKADIRSIQYNEGGGGVMVDQLLLAPVLLVATFGMIQPTVGGGRKSEPPTVADLMPECAASTNPSPSSAALKSKQALADWAWTNRSNVPSGCLLRASSEFRKSDVRRAVELQMLGVAKREWVNARCRDTRLGSFRVLPVLDADGEGPKTGDIALLRRAQEIIADDRTYGDPMPGDVCGNSQVVTDAAELEERRRLLAARLNPFSREPFIAFGKAVATTSRNTEPHPVHNRLGPTIMR